LAVNSIRATTPEDIPRLHELMVEAGLAPNFEPEHLRWKYWQERADFPGPRSFVMTRGSDILAHAAIVPGVCLFGGERVRTVHLIDWAARPSAPGAGVALLKHLGQTADALLAIGGSAQTLRVLPHLGFRRWGDATGYVRTLHPLRILTPSANPVRTLGPRVVRSMLWELAAPSSRVRGWTVRRLARNEMAQVSTVLPKSTDDLVVFERNAALFEYCLSSPISSMTFHVLERGGRVRGYFLMSYAFRQARLADCWIDSDDPADWCALIKSAVHEAKQHPQAAELIAWGSDVVLSRRLLECGFHARGAVPIQVDAPRYPSLHECAVRVQMLDNDTAYRHAGRNEFWA
jgi:hypothetical protein